MRYPILGALYHPPGGIIRHDAVNWGYARAIDNYGIHIHQKTEVTGITVENGRVEAVETTRGRIATKCVLNCTAGWSGLISAMVGLSLPITTHPLQAAVTEPVRHFLGAVIVSGTLHVYVSQSDRGELVFGASVDPYSSYSTRGSLEFTEELASHVLALMPSIDKIRLVRQWAGLCDMTPDFSPIMGLHTCGRVLSRRRMGHLRFQSRACMRRNHGSTCRQRKDSRTDCSLSTGPL